MSAQTSYDIKQPEAYAGLIYAQSPHDIISRTVETAAGIDFAVAVSRGTDKDKQCALGGNDFIGITVRSLDREGAINTGAIKYSVKETAAIMRGGYIWATCPTGCVPGDLVKYDNATGVLDSGTAATDETQIVSATWDKTAAAGQLSVIRISGIATVAGS
jgi:hypothetical protein